MLDVLKKIVQEVSDAKDLASALELIVHNIQRIMQVEVCSVYLFDPRDQRYVLRASEGLNKESINNVRLSYSEGLVGLTVERAEPINLDNASEHKSFKYIKETGEERFRSFMGIPIIHHRKVLGVLVVQQTTPRCFDSNEEAFLVTLSAQLAGVIAHTEATGALGKQKQQNKAANLRFKGLAGSAGVAIGQAVVVTPVANLSSVPDKAAKNIDEEIVNFENALQQVKRDIKIVGCNLAERLRSEEQSLFDVYLNMLDDNLLHTKVINNIVEGNWAQGSLREVITEQVQQFSMMEDPYLRERASDIKDLGRRILSYLQQTTPVSIDFTDNTILIAKELTPAMLGEVPSHKLAGLVSVQGSTNSHVAILARSMGVPAVLGALDLPLVRIDGMELVVDGYSGYIHIQPGEDLLKAYREIVRDEHKQAAELSLLKDLPAETTDGYHLPLWVNTGLIADIARSLQQGAEGIGLYRTEIPFMIREFFPSEKEQMQTYRRQLQAFSPRPVTMRTLDIGGDKALSYFPIKEENPFLGWRGIRVTQDHPEIFLTQIRAMLKANEGYGNLRIMLPMVTDISEVDEANRMIDRAVRELQEEGLQIKRPPVGVMVEVPAAVYQVRRFARRVDFISVGSNDLTQYMLAVDRNNPRVAGLYASFHPAMLKTLLYITTEAHKEDVQVSICGEVASEPGGALLLLAMGYDQLSMNATNLPRIKSAIRSIKKEDAEQLLADVMQMDDAKRIQKLINDRLIALGVSLPTTPVIPV